MKPERSVTKNEQEDADSEVREPIQENHDHTFLTRERMNKVTFEILKEPLNFESPHKIEAQNSIFKKLKIEIANENWKMPKKAMKPTKTIGTMTPMSSLIRRSLILA